MKKKVKIAFVDFWPTFNIHDNLFLDALRENVDYVITELEDAEYIFYCVFGNENLRAKDNQIKIFYTSENTCPDFNLCDYAFGFEWIEFGDRYMRLPHYYQKKYNQDRILAYNKHKNCETKEDRDFCSITISNVAQADNFRILFYQELSKYKRIDSGGNWNNNVGGPVDDKLSFDKTHKFSIAFENSKGDGYTTEKLVQAFAACTVPIYWGDPSVAKVFNENAFINANNFDSVNSLIEEIKAIDSSDERYRKMLKEPAFISNPELKLEELKCFLLNIFTQSKSKALRRNFSYWGHHIRDMRLEYVSLLEKKENFYYHVKMALLTSTLYKFLKGR